MGEGSPDITRLLQALSGGDQTAHEQLIPLVYDELHRLAHRHMIRERAGHVLQTTALVHEVYLRLVDVEGVSWRDRAHFFAVSAQVMRRILVDAARSSGSLKRGGNICRVELDEGRLASLDRGEDLVALDDALLALEQLNPRKARVIEMRFFGGLSVEETAEALGVSADTVLRDWKLAKVWLLHEMQKGES